MNVCSSGIRRFILWIKSKLLQEECENWLTRLQGLDNLRQCC
jgi:hypothetical protein